MYPQSPFRYPQESVSVLAGPFRHTECPFRYPRKSVSFRSGPLRSISVNRDTGQAMQTLIFVWSLVTGK